MRRLPLVLAAALLLGPALGAAAVVVAPGAPEQLVEGHVVFSVVQVARDVSTQEERFATAVAVLVREMSHQDTGTRFPGVLWFNDQFLMEPSKSVRYRESHRYPCTGAVIAVPAGGPDPRSLDFSLATYVESYHLTDPNDRAWDVDKWSFPDTLAWTVALLNRGSDSATPDDGRANCTAYTDGPCAGPYVMPYIGNEESVDDPEDDGVDDGRTRNLCWGGGAGSADNGYRYPCGGDGDPACKSIRHNAVLYFLFEDLADAPSGANKNHTAGSADRVQDVSGCQPTYATYSYSGAEYWPCPSGDDDREGNSHGYHPETEWPRLVAAGRGNHGGSADCDGDGFADAPDGAALPYGGDYECHATRDVLIHYGVAPVPLARTYRLMDTEGATAPYHCHDAMATCNEVEGFAVVPPGA